MKFITRLFLFALILIPAAAVASGSEFITTWQTTTPGESITIPTNGGGYNYDVDWGDATTSLAQTGDATHSYTSPGIHTVTITGDFPRIYFNAGGDKDKIISVEQWGSQVWGGMAQAFNGCSNLVINASDAPNLSAVTDFSGMFQDATSFNQDISSWDTSHVTNIGWMFSGATSFNQPLNTWDVSHVTYMNGVFNQAEAFNQPLNSWDVSSANTMSFMFTGAIVFNQDISSWDVSHVTDFSEMFSDMGTFNQPLNNWDVSSALTMMRMFYRSSAFNQPLNNWDTSHITNMEQVFTSATAFNQSIDSWNVSAVTTMQGMFQGASSFNQPLNSWDVSHIADMSAVFAGATSFNQPLNNWDTSQVTSMTAMFAGAVSFDQDISSWDVSQVTSFNYGPYGFLDAGNLSQGNYDALLTAWSQQSLQSGLVLGMGTSQYCNADSARASIISHYNWTITDGGDACQEVPSILVSTGHMASSPKPFYPVVNPVVPIVPVTPPNSVLKLGAKGGAVKELQKFLISKGYAVIADGSFGNKTKKALQKFQKSHGLTADGILGKKTLATMK